MADDSHATPLAPRNHPRSDEEVAITKTKSADHHRSSSKCLVYILLAIVLQSIAFLVFGLVVLRFKSPKVKIELVQIKNLKYNPSAASSSLNMTMVAQVNMQNSNYGRFKFEKSSISVSYGNSTLGVADIDGGHVKAKETARMNFTVQVRAENGIAENANFSSDIGSGLVKLSSFAKLRGEIRALKIITRHRIAIMNCTMNLNLKSQETQDLRCM